MLNYFSILQFLLHFDEVNAAYSKRYENAFKTLQNSNTLNMHINILHIYNAHYYA